MKYVESHIITYVELRKGIRYRAEGCTLEDSLFGRGTRGILTPILRNCLFQHGQISLYVVFGHLNICKIRNTTEKRT